MINHKEFTRETKNKMIDLVRKGESIRYVGTVYGCPLSTLHKWCADRGVHSHYAPQHRVSDRILLQTIRKNKYISMRRLEQLLGFSPNGLRRRLNRLMTMNFIDYIVAHDSHTPTRLYFYTSNRGKKQ